MSEMEGIPMSEPSELDTTTPDLAALSDDERAALAAEVAAIAQDATEETGH